MCVRLRWLGKIRWCLCKLSQLGMAKRAVKDVVEGVRRGLVGSIGVREAAVAAKEIVGHVLKTRRPSSEQEVSQAQLDQISALASRRQARWA